MLFESSSQVKHRCALMCSIETAEDTQEHMLECPLLQNVRDNVNVKVAYSDIYGDISKQKNVSVMYVALMAERDRLLENTSRNHIM